MNNDDGIDGTGGIGGGKKERKITPDIFECPVNFFQQRQKAGLAGNAKKKRIKVQRRTNKSHPVKKSDDGS